MGLFRRRERAIACSAVVVAAGQSTRMGEIDKIMLPIDGIPVIVRSLRCLASSCHVQEIVVVTRQELLVPISELLKEYGVSKVSKLIVGGEDRMSSVTLGLEQVNEKAEYIAIHDGARPFATETLITSVIEAARDYHAAAPAVSVRESMRRTQGVKNEIVERNGLVAMQTPQVFDADLIKAALVKALQDGCQFTDDCSAAEYLGMKIHLTEGDGRNIKITTPVDIAMAEGISLSWEEQG